MHKGRADRRAAGLPRKVLGWKAASRFALGDENPVIAHDLRVSVRSVQRWRKAWSHDGPRDLASKGPASLPLLSHELFAVLEQEVAKGPVVHGWPDQTWTRHGSRRSSGTSCTRATPSKALPRCSSGMAEAARCRPGGR